MHRRKAGALWLAFLACALCAIPFHAARAHASLLSSTPSNGAHLATSPSQIRLLFSEELVASLSHFGLEGSDGRETKLDVYRDPHDVHALVGTVPSLPAGAYRLNWHVVSDDGHPVSGSVAFTVGDTAIAAAMPVPKPTAAQAMTDMEPTLGGAALIPAFLRGAALCVLLAVCGLLGFTAYSENGASSSQQRVIQWLSGAATLLLLAHFISWLVHVSPTTSLDSEFVIASLSEHVGANEFARLVLAALVAWAVLLANRPRWAFAFALAAVLAGGTIGHSAAIHPNIAIPMKAFHLVAVAFWIGGVLWLLLQDPDSVETALAASTVSNIALASISIVAISGVVQTVLFLNKPGDLIQSQYGITILAKVAGLLALASFGVYHRSCIRNQIPNTIFRKSLRRELIVMMLVVMIGGFLAYVPTPMRH